MRREDGSWLVDGQLGIHEAERLLERDDLAQGDNYYSVAGFVLWRLPAAGETPTWRDLRIEILDMDGTWIDKVLITARVAAFATEGAIQS